MTYRATRDAIINMIPKLDGWPLYTGGIAPANAKPPWVVAGVSETTRTHTESQTTDLHIGKLDIRIVARTQLAVDTLADLLTRRLDGADPHAVGVSPLIGDTDTGSMPSDLIDPDTGSPYMMRGLTWRVAWN